MRVRPLALCRGPYAKRGTMIERIGGMDEEGGKPSLVIKVRTRPISKLGGEPEAEEAMEGEESQTTESVDAKKEAARLVAKALGASTANIEGLSKALSAFVGACGSESESAETDEQP